jgi:pSer/pThr/pTyr-binding forkhead associated (FHA) protein/S1-C subfamily serine protease
LSSSPSSSPSSEGGGVGEGLKKPIAAVLIVRTGARTGRRLHLTADFATLGRHDSSDLQFDPDKDREVSARHAAVFRQGPTFVVRDLGSTNGTWLNGERIRSDRPLEAGDRIRLGAQGPEVEFTLTTVEHRPTPVVAAQSRDELSRPIGHERSSAGFERVESPTDLRIRMEVARQTDRLRRRIGAGVIAGLVLIATTVGWFSYRGSLRRREVAAEQTRLLTQVDSLQRVLASASNQASVLRLALDSARIDAGVLRARIAEGGLDPDSLSVLDQRVAETILQHTRLLEAADFDVSDLRRANAPAVVMIFAENRDGRSFSSTGFVARSVGDTGWIVTARHAVTDGQGRPAVRVVTGFPGRPNVYRTTLLRLHDSLDLALLRVISQSGVPSVSRLDAIPATVGDPTAVIGYPLGLDLPMAGGSIPGSLDLSPTTSRATVSRTLPSLLQLDGYGVDGISGSPIFGVTGGVIGMLYGGAAGGGGRIIYAVPMAHILTFMDRS